MKYNKVLLFGSTGAGKSTTAEKLSVLKGCPLLHVDLVRFNDDFSMNSNERIINTVFDFINNPSWVLDYTPVNENDLFLRELVDESDLTLHFSFSIEDSIKGYYKKYAEMKSGIPPKGLPNCRNAFSEDTLRMLIDANARRIREWPDLKRKLGPLNSKIKIISSYADIDRFIEQF